ncbi:LPS biosynthesis choline kinase [Pasteurellaceae bacterium Orientalotternb1]|nr:LPS biosynthesis choline kinase [Pasteurellaceae bacterium Orientalotternb1]
MPTNSALQWLTQTQQQAVRSVEKLTGLTACSQLVTLENGERYVLRNQNQRASNFGVDYQQESQILAQIRPLAIAPDPLYANAQQSLLSWIDGSVPTEFSSDLLQKLAEQLAKLHRFKLQAVSSNQNFTILNLTERCHFLWQKLPAQKQAELPFSPPFPQIEPFAHALCHHDLHLGNLVEQGDKLFIIDWEYAAVSDPALDLALFLHANPLSEAEQAVFFQHYFAKSPLDLTACRTKIAEYQPLIAMLNQLWYAFG